MRLNNYLKEDWVIKGSNQVYRIFKNRWGHGNSDELIIYVYHEPSKNLFWKIESDDFIIKNNYESVYNSRTEDHTGILIKIGAGINIEWGKGWAHGLILKNHIYPYEDEEINLSQSSFFAIKRCINKKWWIKT